ncbi:WLM-domain-containing protein [Xylaria nigripes]|nr:WLM-domain-containing protein [Xylaria nigripes]
MPEVNPLILSYSHLAKFPNAAEALHLLKWVASMVKPLMRARGWKVCQLTEFYPSEHNLLGLNVERGHKICLRLRYAGDKTKFLPMSQISDTMLHELAHIKYGPHDAKFHALWNELRDEQLSLINKGYTGVGFLSEGHRLGGKAIPKDEARRLARKEASKRSTQGTGSGQRLGGAAPRPGRDIRNVISDAVDRRNETLKGCGIDKQTLREIMKLADTATRNGFKTRAEEDAANDAAIAQALWELVQEEKKAKGTIYIPPVPDSIIRHLNHPTRRRGDIAQPSTSRDQGSNKTWICTACTLQNRASHLCCDACGAEKAEKSATRSRTTIDLTGPSKSEKSQGKKSASSRIAKAR